jgi:anti-sigma-K factor RskA
MSAHPQFAEDLALYALGSLRTNEQAEVERHLEECTACRTELQRLRGDMALLALSVAGPLPPQRARVRLLAGVSREPRLKLGARKRSWWAPLPWVAVAALALIATWLWQQNSGLREEIASLRSESGEQLSQLQRAREVVDTLTATGAMRVTLVAAKTPPQPQGKAFYVRDRGTLVFMANNLPALPAQKAYELWLIPVQGAPLAAGVFKPDARGGATVINPPLPAGTEARAFAITVEPEGGSPTPTMPIVMLGAGE